MNTLIGSIIKTHGFDGALVISTENQIDIELIENCINKKGFVFINIDEIQVPFFITEKTKVLNNKSILIYLDDIFNDNQAKKYISSKIFVEDDCFDKKIEAKLIVNHDLIGFLVIDENLGIIGNIFDFINIPSNPLLIVKKSDKEILIPINDDFIIEINNEDKKIIIELPEGLIEINN